MILTVWSTTFVKSFRTAYPGAWWFGLGPLATIGTAPILIVFGFGVVPDQRAPLYYLLGAQAETLGTIFVLAFTLSMVAAQVATRYNRILFDRVLGGWALWYALPFIIGIILPLFLLHGHFFLWATQISLLIAVYCVTSLLPFTAAVRKLLSISEVMNEKQNEIMSAKSEEVAKQLIGELSGIAIGAVHVNDYVAFERGIEKLVMVAGDRTDERCLTSSVGVEVLRMLRRHAGNEFASGTLLEAMIDIGLKEPSTQRTDLTEFALDQLVEAYKLADIAALRSHSHVIRTIGQFAQSGIRCRQVVIVRKCQAILYTIGERSVSELPAASDTGRDAIQMLGEIMQSTLASSLVSTDQDVLLYQALVQIETLGTKAMADNKTDIAGSAQVQIRRVAHNNSVNGRRVRNRAEASLAVLGEESTSWR